MLTRVNLCLVLSVYNNTVYYNILVFSCLYLFKIVFKNFNFSSINNCTLYNLCF